MKFWLLVSICYPNSSALEQLLQEPQWAAYLKWFQEFGDHVNSQNRAILDAVLPEPLIVSAMKLCDYRFRVQDGVLRLSHEEFDDSIATIDVYLRYGAEAIDEVLEKGSFMVKNHRRSP